MSRPTGGAAVVRWLSEACGAGSEVELLICVEDGLDVFAEGRADDLTCASSLRRRSDGTVARSLFFTCALVESPAVWEPGERPTVRPLLERYFALLNEGDFSGAAACFSDDCLYSHPPYRPGEARAAFRGRFELAEQWPLRRGTKRVETTIERCVQDGNHAFVEGVAAGGSFLSTIVLAPDGLISRYLAFYRPQRVARR